MLGHQLFHAGLVDALVRADGFWSRITLARVNALDTMNSVVINRKPRGAAPLLGGSAHTLESAVPGRGDRA